MERFAWRAHIKPDTIEEYEKRHSALWPEMRQVLNDAGIHNYTLWNVDDELFGYYECESIEYADKIQSDSPVVEKWNEFMADILIMDPDPATGKPSLFKLRQVFIHE